MKNLIISLLLITCFAIACESHPPTIATNENVTLFDISGKLTPTPQFDSYYFGNQNYTIEFTDSDNITRYFSNVRKIVIERQQP